MITGQEIVSGVYGALRLAARDPTGLAFFDVTPQGFWRSFAAALVGLPAYAVLIATGPAIEEARVDGAAFFLIEAIAYGIQWLALPVLMLHVAPALGRVERYIPFVVAWNWAAVVQLQLFALLAALGGLSLLPGGVLDVLVWGMLAWVLVYQWYVARTSLAVNGMAAAGVVALDFFLSLVITGTSRMIEA